MHQKLWCAAFSLGALTAMVCALRISDRTLFGKDQDFCDKACMHASGCCTERRGGICFVGAPDKSGSCHFKSLYVTSAVLLAALLVLAISLYFLCQNPRSTDDVI